MWAHRQNNPKSSSNSTSEQSMVGKLVIGPSSGAVGRSLPTSPVAPLNSFPQFDSLFPQPQNVPLDTDSASTSSSQSNNSNTKMGFFRRRQGKPDPGVAEPKPNPPTPSPPHPSSSLQAEREISRSLSEEWKVDKPKVWKKSASFHRPKPSQSEPTTTSLGGSSGVGLPPRPGNSLHPMIGAESVPYYSNLSQISPPSTPPNPRFSPGPKEKSPLAMSGDHRNSQYQSPGTTAFVNANSNSTNSYPPMYPPPSPPRPSPRRSMSANETSPSGASGNVLGDFPSRNSPHLEVASLRGSVTSLQSTVEGLVLTLQHLVKAQQIQSQGQSQVQGQGQIPGQGGQESQATIRAIAEEQRAIFDDLKDEIRRMGEGFRQGFTELANMIRIKDEQQQARMYNLAGIDGTDSLVPLPTDTGVPPSVFPLSRDEFSRLSPDAVQNLLQQYGLPLEPIHSRMERLERFVGYR